MGKNGNLYMIEILVITWSLVRPSTPYMLPMLNVTFTTSTVPNGRSLWTWKMTIACQLNMPSIWRWIDSCQSRVFFPTKFLQTWNTYDISSIKRVIGKFHVVVVQTTGKKCTKKVCCTCKVVFCSLDLLLCPFFAYLVAFLPFRIT